MENIYLEHEGTEFNRIAGNEKNAVYYNEELNNLIIVTTDAFNDEKSCENDDTVLDAFNYLVNDRFEDFCASAEYFTNATIFVHKPWHTTTDFIANYDLDPKKLLRQSRSVKGYSRAFFKACPKLISYKLIEIMEGQAYKWGEIPEEIFEAFDSKPINQLELA